MSDETNDRLRVTAALQTMAIAVRKCSPSFLGWDSVDGRTALSEIEKLTRDQYSQIQMYLKTNPSPFTTVSHQELVFLLDLLRNELRDDSQTDVFETVMSTVQYYNRKGTLNLPIAGLSWGVSLRFTVGVASIANASMFDPGLKIYARKWARVDQRGAQIIAWHSAMEWPYLHVPLSRLMQAMDRGGWMEIANRTLAMLRLWQMFVYGRSGRFGRHGFARIGLGSNPASLPISPFVVLDDERNSELPIRFAVPPVDAASVMVSPTTRLVPLDETVDNAIGDSVFKAIGRLNHWAFRGNDFQERFLTALQLLNKSYETDDEREIVLFNVMILETLFNVYYGTHVRGIQDSVATTYAIVLESDAGQRTKLMGQVKDVYELRSKAVHRWKGGFHAKDIELADGLAIKGIAAIAMLLDTIDSVESFESQLKDAFLRVAVPFWGQSGRPPQ